jgi:ferredoxin
MLTRSRERQDRMKIVVNWALCDGNGVCVVEAPGVFDLDDEDTLHVLQESPPSELTAPVLSAVRSCPKRALSIEQ